jgi:hypothetical protein
VVCEDAKEDGKEDGKEEAKEDAKEGVNKNTRTGAIAVSAHSSQNRRTNLGTYVAVLITGPSHYLFRNLTQAWSNAHICSHYGSICIVHE